jgi:glycosyltransferase involved in cell wall biosynthesis
MGTDHKVFFPGNTGIEDIDIVFTGFFGHYPNTDAVLYFNDRILPIVREKIPRVKFFIVGSEPPDSVLSLMRDSDITVTGHVDDIRPYLSRSKVFIMPIRLGRGMRGKMFEAWGMARPVVSTTAGCEGAKVFDGGNILIADGPEAFAEKIISLLMDEKKRREIGMNGRKAVEELYNWDHIADSLEKIYFERLGKC